MKIAHALILALAVVLSSASGAQTTPPSALPPGSDSGFGLRRGTTIKVVTASGEEVVGRLMQSTADSILLSDASRTGSAVPLSAISKLYVRQNRTGRKVLGLTLGLIGGVVVGSTLALDDDDVKCPSLENCFDTIDSEVQNGLAGAVLGGMVGSTIGFAIASVGSPWKEHALTRVSLHQHRSGLRVAVSLGSHGRHAQSR